MPIKRTDGKELTYKDKIVHYGVLYNFLYGIKGMDKYTRGWIKTLKKLNNDEKTEVAKRVTRIFDIFVDEFEGMKYELAVVLESVVRFDINSLNSIGFNTEEFLSTSLINTKYPNPEYKAISARIIFVIKESMKQEGLEIKTMLLDKKLNDYKEEVITKAVQGFVNIDVSANSKWYISSIRTKDIIMLYFYRSVIYAKVEEDVLVINDAYVVGIGGEIVSNMLPINDVKVSIGIKICDEGIYLFKVTYGSDEIEESILNIEKAYRYTLEYDKYGRVLITRWINKSERIDSFLFDIVDIYTNSDIDIKPTGIKPFELPDKMLRKSGVKDLDLTRCVKYDDFYLLVKGNGNAVCVNEEGRKQKKFRNVDFILNKDTEEPIYRNDVSVKILI